MWNINRISYTILQATNLRSLVHCIRKGHTIDDITNVYHAPLNNYPSRAILTVYGATGFGLDCSPQNYCTDTSHSRKLPILTLYTKQPCPLCDQALHQLKPYLNQVSLEKVDITAPENKVWWNAYRYDIPVFHLNGRFLMKHKADLDKLKIALNDFQKNSNPS